jgi:hypothetical protein
MAMELEQWLYGGVWNVFFGNKHRGHWKTGLKDGADMCDFFQSCIYFRNLRFEVVFFSEFTINLILDF